MKVFNSTSNCITELFKDVKLSLFHLAYFTSEFFARTNSNFELNNYNSFNF